MRKVVHICDVCGREEAIRCPICGRDVCSEHYTPLCEDIKICTKHLLGVYISIHNLRKLYEGVVYLDQDYWNLIKDSKYDQWIAVGVSEDGEMLYAGIFDEEKEMLRTVTELVTEGRVNMMVYRNGSFYFPKVTVELEEVELK